MPTEQDEVSAMQDAVDQLALSMFDALRLIPFSEEVKAGKRGGVGQPGQHDPDAAVVKRAVAMDSSWATHVQSLAEGVLKQARTVDGLIDTLPGADLREDQQMEEIARLDEESRRKRAELAKTVEKAEELSKGVIGSLDQLADHMLAAPR